MNAFAEAELNEKAVEKRLVEYIHRIPVSARSFGIRMENKIPNTEDIAHAAKERLFIKVKPA